MDFEKKARELYEDLRKLTFLDDESAIYCLIGKLRECYEAGKAEKEAELAKVVRVIKSGLSMYDIKSFAGDNLDRWATWAAMTIAAMEQAQGDKG